MVGLIGFSQGTKVVAGLLRGTEIVRSRRAGGEKVEGEEGERWCDFKFGLSVCGSYPPPLVPAGLEDAAKGSSAASGSEAVKIHIPCFHVQGLQDEWKWAGQGLIEGFYEVGEGKSEVVEWEMGHHYPVPVEESERIRDWMLKVMGMEVKSEAGVEVR